jgi:NAD-dependent SIR2 family protein deacetylase
MNHKISKQLQGTEVSVTIDNIIEGINSGISIVFCGSGISRNSGLPVVKELIPYILQKLDVSEDDKKLILDKDNYPKIPFEAFMQILHDNIFFDNLIDIFNKGEPNVNHLLLAKLIKTGKLRTIVTTNFDRLIERALSFEPQALLEGKDYDVLFMEKDFNNIAWSEDRIRIVKIHGSVDNKETMAITLNWVAS